jgi:hypothetical protein
MARKTAARKTGRGGKAASARQGRVRKAARQVGGDSERSNYRTKRRAEKMDEAAKKEGCLPKLGMLILPFIAAGAYLLLRA